VVLALIVLLSIIVVSFISFSRLNRSATFSYSKQIQAQEIAHGGLEDILSDLRTEIIAGSTTQNGGAGYAPVYVPTTNWTAQPARLGYSPSAFGTDVNSTNAAGLYLLPPTLVRISKAAQDSTPTDFFPPLNSTYYTGALPPNRASAAPTTNAAANGRVVSLARWAEIDLLSTNSSSAYLPTPFTTNAPDWVYVTRAGSRACIPSDLPGMLPAPLSGAPTSTANASPVVGRYAYVVYDEGALLDVNAAGYTSPSTNNFAALTNFPGAAAPANSYVDPSTAIAQVSPAKTYTSYADLTQLPGFNLAGGQTNIDNLVKWRYGSVNLSTTGSAGTNFYQTVFKYAKYGNLAFQTTSTGTDSPIVSRQDLINYFANIDPTGTSYAAALPYLGTFTRAANAPSWNPIANSSSLAGYYGLANPHGYNFVTQNPSANNSTQFSTMLYKSNEESSTDGTIDPGGNSTHNANPDIPSVRWAVSGTVIHYNDDGTYYTYQVKKGDPLVQHRFSLARIAWLNFSNATTGLNTTGTTTPFNSSLSPSLEASAVQDSFGLAWDPQQFSFSATSPPNYHLPHFDCWDYVSSNLDSHYTGSTASDVHILTLGEVANGVTSATNSSYYREPNFFEMLKTGILSGSLGQASGPICQGNLVSGGTFEGTHGLYNEIYYSEKNRHILQIGVNIIDQFDSDSIPTAIHMGTAVKDSFWNSSNDVDLAFNTVYGDENLPGITRLYQNMIEDWYNTTTKQGAVKSWIVPEIWNIHQVPPTGIDLGLAADAGSPGSPHPTQLRVHGYGCFAWCLYGGGGSQLPWIAPYTLSQGATATTAMDWDFAPSAQNANYTDATTGLSGTGTPNGATGTITCSQLPSPASSTVVAATVNTPANYVYFRDLGSAASPFYRYPDYLQLSNLYNGFTFGNPFPIKGAFMGTHPLCAWASPADLNIPSDSGVAQPPGTSTDIEFLGLFGGEEPLGDLSVSTYAGSSFDYSLDTNLPIYFSLECQDPVTLNWHPYNWISAIRNSADNTDYLLGDNAGGVYLSPNQNYVGTPGTGNAANGQTFSLGRGGALVRVDPRTDRFSIMTQRMYWNQKANNTMYPTPTVQSEIEDNFPTRTWGFVYTPDQGANPKIFGGTGDSYPTWWAVNLATVSNDTSFYVDPDGVVRPGDGYRENTATGDGCLLYHGCTGGGGPPPTGPPSAANATGIGTTPVSLTPTSVSASGENIPSNSGQARRPAILNRPFRNVGELGYAFRDLPFKTIDFFSRYSGDAALLDLFSVTDEPASSAGQVNVSNAPASTLKAIMTGATKQEINPPYTAKYDAGATGVTGNYPSTVSPSNGAPNFITPTEAATIASQLVTSFSTSGPIDNRADLVARLDPIIGTPPAPAAAATAYASTSLIGQGYLDYANKAVAEAPLRALSGTTSTRTWNLLIDIIAQSGQMSPLAKATDTNALSEFIVQGERRYWLHISIDRYTGKVIDQQLEPVYE
jgi:hypothetical protein